MLKYIALFVGLVLSLTGPATAQTAFLNGELNVSTGTFDWTNGGGDPLQSRWTASGFQRSLALARLNLPDRVEAGLRQTLMGAPHARVDLAQVYRNKVVGDVMVSGDGWIALRPRAMTDSWRSGRSTMASWYVWTDPVTRERWEIIVPDVCNNLILTRLGQAVACTCIPQEGDACPGH